jgi:putative transposase
MVPYIGVTKFNSYGQSGKIRVYISFSGPKYCSEMNPIELEWQHIKKDELAGEMFEDELDIAYAVIQGVEVRGERGKYLTQRVKFNSNPGT